jgi:DNA-binding response OmpR family regulator
LAVNRVLHGPGKVLVVDDDRDTRDLLQAALEQRGFTVVLTSSGKRAVMLARRHPISSCSISAGYGRLRGAAAAEGMPETAEIQ